MMRRSSLLLVSDLPRSPLRLLGEMDARLRELERQAATGDPDAHARLNRMRVRAGQVQLLGGHSGNFQHVPHSDHPDNRAYRDGYKAGWAHAHRNPDQPPQPDQSHGPQYVQGYMHGHEVSGHAQSVLGAVRNSDELFHPEDRRRLRGQAMQSLDQIVGSHPHITGDVNHEQAKRWRDLYGLRDVSRMVDAFNRGGRSPRRVAWTPHSLAGDDRYFRDGDHWYERPSGEALHPADFTQAVRQTVGLDPMNTADESRHTNALDRFSDENRAVETGNT